MKATACVLVFAALICNPLWGQRGMEDNLATEINFTPFSDAPLSLEGIKLRYFLDDELVLRAQFSVAAHQETAILYPIGSLSAPDGTFNTAAVDSVYTSFDFLLAPGIEKHFEGTDNLAPYIGASFFWGTGNVEHESGTWGAIQPTDVDNPGAWITWYTVQTTPYRRVGFSLFTGCDFYFADHIYLGAEFGFTLDRVNWKDTETTFSHFRAYQIEQAASSGQEIDDVEAPVAQSNGSSRSFGPSVSGAIRLGYVFGR